uniref:Uncharacterized protein n=1 Tax=Arundo donax TaxID=35708 RepID=A0A0A9HG97_ARUDO
MLRRLNPLFLIPLHNRRHLLSRVIAMGLHVATCGCLATSLGLELASSTALAAPPHLLFLLLPPSPPTTPSHRRLKSPPPLLGATHRRCAVSPRQNWWWARVHGAPNCTYPRLPPPIRCAGTSSLTLGLGFGAHGHCCCRCSSSSPAVERAGSRPCYSSRWCLPVVVWL